MIGVHVRIDHMGDLHPLVGRERGIGVQITLVRIDDSTLAEAAAAEQVAGAAGLEGVVGPEDHGLASSQVSIGQPSLRHSGTP